MPRISFIKGQSKNPIVPGVCLIDEKFKYFYNKTISDGSKGKPISLFYTCSMKKSSKCLASVILVKDGERWWPKDLSGVEDHNHMVESGDILAHKLKKDMYERVKADPLIPGDTVYRTVVTEYEDEYAENHEGVWDDATIKLTRKENIARHVRRVKATINGPVPQNRNEFDPETVVKQTLGGKKVIVLDSNKHLGDDFDEQFKNFVDGQNISQNGGTLDSYLDGSTNEVEEADGSMHNSENETSVEDNEDGYARSSMPKRVIIYTTNNLIKLLSEGKKSSGDGTFKTCPSLWKQIFIIMVKLNNQWIPVSYAMLPDKTQKSYFTMFYMLMGHIKDNAMDFNIESMRMDFEIASMKTAAGVFKVLVKGCYFQFTQAG